jgi:anaerobic dimethyl sulfoxide reductase subunit A
LTERQYDTKTDNEIRNLILDKLNTMGYNFEDRYANDMDPVTNAATAEATYEAMKGPYTLYSNLVDPEAASKVKTYEEFCATGTMDWPIPKGKSIVGFQTFSVPPNLQNTTGRINFYQPLWGQIRPKTPKTYTDPWGLTHDGFRNPTAKYQPNIEGYEKFFVGNDPTGEFKGFTSPVSGRTYELFYMTNKSRNRAHTVFDNVAMIKDKFVQKVHINPVDAAVRGIKDGDTVYVYNDRGCMKLPASVSHYMIPGVISIEHGAWYRPHPTETCKVWLDTEIDSSGSPVFKEYTVKVDVGGAENLLTMGIGSSEQYVGQAISAHGGPCEVSLTKPE